MKNYLLLIITLVIVSCSDQMGIDEVYGKQTVQVPGSELSILLEKAKWGDGHAYVELADCYRDGKGVKKDLINMLSMVALAVQYSGIQRMEDYLDSLPEDSEFKLIIDASELYSRKKAEESEAKIEQLIAMGSIEGYSLKGIFAIERGDVDEGRRLIENAAAQGSTFAELLLCVPDRQGGKNSNMEEMKKLTDKVPFANILLADAYSGRDGETLENDSLAAYYYIKADEKACLNKRGARWLLNYQKSGGNLQLSERDMERIQVLAKDE